MKSVLYLLSFSILISCGSRKKQVEANNTASEIWIVADRQMECVGEGVTHCLVYKVQGEQKWQIIYDGVEGFNYEEGRHYEIEIRKENVENPPADASSIRYILIKILEDREARPIEGVINDTWGVVELNGKSVFPGKQEMTLELNSRQNTMNAYAGCNSIGGSLEILDGDSRSIRLRSLFATEKFCEGKMELEKEYQQVLKRMNRLDFERAELHAYFDDQLLFIARRID